MPGKNGKKGFLKLSNEEVAVMGRQGEDSGSEIELLDVTEIDHYGRDIERKSRGRGCCCDCCIVFYLFLITIAIVFIILFVLGTAYNVQVLKTQVSDMDSTVQSLKTDLNNLKQKHEEQAKKYTSHLHTLNTSLTTLKSSVTGLTSSVTSLTSKVQQIESKMSDFESIATQLNVAQMDTFNKSMTTVLSFSKDVNDIHISMAHLNSIIDSLNDQVTETKEYCSDFGTKIETISSKTSEANDAIKVIKNNHKARNKYVDLKLLKLNYFKGNTTQKLHQMEWALKTSPEELINTFLNRTSPSEDHLNEIIDLKQKLTELHETMDFVLGKLTNLTETTPTVPVTPPPTNATVKIIPITDQTTPSSSKTPDTSPKHSSTSATEDHPKTDVETSATPTRSPNTTTSANKPHPTDATNKTINMQPNFTAPDNDNNETTLPTGNKTTPTGNKTTPTGNSTDLNTLPGNTTETPTSSTQRAEQALKHILDSFDNNDVDQDGRLSLKEFRQIYDNPNIFDILDTNHDGNITKTELKELLKHVQDEETNLPPTPQDYNDYNDSDNDALTPDNNKP